jgi:hypothetical protein
VIDVPASVDFERNVTATGCAALAFAGIGAEVSARPIARRRRRRRSVPQAAIVGVMVIQEAQATASDLLAKTRARHGNILLVISHSLGHNPDCLTDDQ